MAEVLATYDYTLLSDDTYSVTCNNRSICTQAIIPSEYNGKSVTSIRDYAFNGCSLLTSITIPESVTNIGEDAFSSSYSLTNVTIPNSVTSIGKEAFYDCVSLTKVLIGDSVTSIRDYAFSSCTALKTVIFKIVAVPTLGINVFSSSSNLSEIIVPLESVDAYKTALGTEYENLVVGKDTVYFSFLNYSTVINEKFIKKDDDVVRKQELDAHIFNINNPHSVTKSQVGLGNVDNTSDANKPISTATQNALTTIQLDIDGKATQLVMDSSTYVLTLKDKGGNTLGQPIDLPLETMVVGATYDSVNKKIILTLKNGQTIDVPVSDLISGLVTVTELNNHTSNTSNPHSVTKTQVGLEKVDNTSDLDKPISTATQNELNLKQNITDNSLQTTNKTIVGAINELNNKTYQKGTTVTVGGVEQDTWNADTKSNATNFENGSVYDSLKQRDLPYNELVNAIVAGSSYSRLEVIAALASYGITSDTHNYTYGAGSTTLGIENTTGVQGDNSKGIASFNSGIGNKITGNGCSGNLGGTKNTNGGSLSAIIAGNENTIGNNNGRNGIIGGQYNKLDANDAFIGGGIYNEVWNKASAIVGGQHNQIGDDEDANIKARYAVIAGGHTNKIINSTGVDDADFAFVGAGQGNVVQHRNAATLGGYGLKTGRAQQALVGQFNGVAPNVLFAVGNGTSDNDRKNAFVVLDDGTVRAYGTPSNENDLIRKQDLKTYLKDSQPLTNDAIMGGLNNSIDSNIINSVIAGGYTNRIAPEPGTPEILDANGFIGGGQGNQIVGYKNVGMLGGQGLRARWGNQAITGKFNAPSKALFIVGKGTSDLDRSNALEVLEDGRAKVYGAPIENNDVVRKQDVTRVYKHYITVRGYYTPTDVSFTNEYEILSSKSTAFTLDEFKQYLAMNASIVVGGQVYNTSTRSYDKLFAINYGNPVDPDWTDTVLQLVVNKQGNVVMTEDISRSYGTSIVDNVSVW